MTIHIITLFPEMLHGFLSESMMKRAENMGAVRFNLVQLRDFADDKHHTTDDRPFGGGPGMVLKAEPLARAIESVHSAGARVILMTPQGHPFQQADAQRLSQHSGDLILLCGHYEGIDERIVELFVDEEISIGDYVLTNGALPAAVVVDALVRLLPGVVGGEDATELESFSQNMLDYPQYTRPTSFRDLDVPEILKSGDHGAIAKWRKEQALDKTRAIRPDLLEKSQESPDSRLDESP